MTFRRTIAIVAMAAAAVLAAAEVPVSPDSQGSPELQDSPEESLFADGLDAFARGDYASSAAAFATLAKTFPSSERIPDARFLQAKALVMLARFEDAIVVLDTFIELSPNGPRSFEALMLRGEALVAASPLVPHFGDAAISFSMALEIDGLSRENRIDATLHLADALLRMGDRTGADQAFGRLSTAERRAATEAAEARGFRRVARFRPANRT